MSDPYVGKKLSTRRFKIGAATIDDYYRGLEMEPRADGRIPSTIASDPDNAYFNEIAFPNHIGHLWMRQGWTCLGELAADVDYVVEGEIKDIYQKRNRSVVHYETTLTDPSINVVLRTDHHQSFLNEVPEGEVAFRDPNKKEGARVFEVPEGRRFGGLEKKISVEMCGAFFHGDANYHTDKAASRELGFRDVVVGGRMTMAIGATVLENEFGADWWASGRLDIKFTNPVWADDVVRAHGVVRGPLADDPDRTSVFLWLDKPDDTIVLIAEASVAS